MHIHISDLKDKELLELAAKAIGEKLGWDARGPYKIGEGVSGNDTLWNPLADEGDALRLAIDLEIDIETSVGPVCKTYWWNKVEMDYVYFEVPHEKDKRKATRRAVVLAAASIGNTKWEH